MGEKDGWLDPSLALRLRNEIPGSELKLIQEGGHFVQEDAPEEIAKALAGFFSGDEEAGVKVPVRAYANDDVFSSARRVRAVLSASLLLAALAALAAFSAAMRTS